MLKVATLSLFLATPVLAHSEPNPALDFCLGFAELAKAIAIARDRGVDEAAVLNLLLDEGLFEQAPKLSYRVVREVFESPLDPEEIRETGFLNCMEAMK